MPHIHFLNLSRRLVFEKTKKKDNILIIKICFHRRDEDFFFPLKAEEKFHVVRLPISKQDETGSTSQTEKPIAKGKEGEPHNKRKG